MTPGHSRQDTADSCYSIRVNLWSSTVIVGVLAALVPASGSSSPAQGPTARESALCGPSPTSFSNALNDNGRERSWRLKTTSAGCQIDLKQEGKVEFSDDFMDIKSLSRGGTFDLTVLKGGVRRELSVSNKNGALVRTWKVDGRERPYDDDARQWFGAFLIDLDRQTAVGVDSRLPALLRRGGVAEVLKETAQMPGEYARGVYYTSLAAATKLSSSDVVSILDQASSLDTADSYAADLLQSLAGPQIRDPAVRAATVKLLANVKSDYYINQGIQTLLRGSPADGRGRLTADDVDVVIGAALRMSADVFKAEIVRGVVKTGRLDADGRAKLARIAADMREDFYLDDVIEELAGSGALDANARHTLIAAAGRITSDRYRAMSLKALLRDRGLGEADLLELIAAAGKLRADAEKAEVLIAISRHSPPTGRVRDAVSTAADSLVKRYRDLVKEAVGR